jgi:prepilin signal peptidase PulO-like enzyme (type II secretory pathway)
VVNAPSAVHGNAVADYQLVVNYSLFASLIVEIKQLQCFVILGQTLKFEFVMNVTDKCSSRFVLCEKLWGIRMSEKWTHRETELLDGAVEKIVRVGEEVGVTPEEMVAYLDSGCSVRDLLTMLAAKRSGAT